MCHWRFIPTLALLGAMFFISPAVASDVTGIDVTMAGIDVVMDGYTAADGMTTASSTTFTSASSICSPADTGKVIVIAGAGPSSGVHQTTISGCSGSNYILAAAAVSSISATQWSKGSDNSVKLNAAVSAYKNKRLCFPAGQALILSTTIVLDHITLCGQAVPQRRTAPFGESANQGSTILVASTSTQPFTIKQSVEINGLTFFWPGQAGVSVSPLVYPPLFKDDGATQLSDFKVQDSSFINAYDLFTQHPNNVVMGNMRFLNTQAAVFHRAFSISSVGETIYLTSTLWNPSVYAASTLTPPQYLTKWAQQYGSFIYSFGSGTTSTCSNTVGGGLNISATTINGFATVFDVQTGHLDESAISSDSDINGVGQILYVGPAGAITRSSFHGRYYPNGSAGVQTSKPAFDFESTCSGWDQDVVITADIVAAQSTVLKIGGTQLHNLTLTGAVARNYGGQASPSYLAYIDNANTNINITGMTSYPNTPGQDGRGIKILNVASFNYIGSTCYQTYYCVDTSSLSAGRVTIGGLNAADTQSPTTLAGSATNNVRSFGLNVDKDNPPFGATSYTPTFTLVAGASVSGVTGSYSLNGSVMTLQVCYTMSYTSAVPNVIFTLPTPFVQSLVGMMSGANFSTGRFIFGYRYSANQIRALSYDGAYPFTGSGQQQCLNGSFIVQS